MKKNKINFSVKHQLTIILEYVLKYRFIIFFVGVSIIIGFMLIQIMNVVGKEPSAQQKEEASKNIKVIKIDENTLQIIRDLQSQNIQVDALFEQDRYDPFQSQ